MTSQRIYSSMIAILVVGIHFLWHFTGLMVLRPGVRPLPFPRVSWIMLGWSPKYIYVCAFRDECAGLPPIEAAIEAAIHLGDRR